MANVIDSLNFGDVKYSFTLPYGSCSTAAATAAKTVTVDNFSLESGARIAVKFTVTNTASNSTLNVNGTGAKAIYYKGAAISAGYLAANRIREFVYNGTQWELIGDIDTDTNTNTAHSHSAGTGLTISGSGGTSGTTTYAANLNSTTSLGTIGTTGKLYAVGVDANGKLCVNVPWTDTDTNTTYSQATSSTLGLVKIGYYTSGKNYAVQLDSNGQMYVNVPWTDTDTNTTYTAGTGLILNGTTFSLNTGYYGSTSQAGLVQVGSNITVSSGIISLTKNNITSALGYTPPTTNTTYGYVSRTADGLMYSHYYAYLMDHTHSYSTLTDKPTLLTIGTTSTTAAAGNHTHSGYASTSHTHTALSNALTLNHASTTNMFQVQKSGSNVFLVTNAGKVYADVGYYSPAADYAEFMEWDDANSLEADRRGLFVVMENDSNLIRIANDTDDIDDIVGIVSSCPSMVGNSAELHWNKKYVTDIFGNIEMETITQSEYIDNEGNIVPAQVIEIPKLNPDYDPNIEYIPRSQRKEWAVIGLLGQIIMIDDGTCIVGKRCRNGVNGVATLSNNKEGWRVIERLDDTHIKVLFK